ncbi:unnamed protein product [Ilex paraguariensis]|uniref:Uncharacterized protein n=1 Tax=Ilex paraguariensis TaxID=185542 RepID=A0ABC8SQN5_9AQUA
MNRWLASIENGLFRTKEAITLMVRAETGGFEAGFLFRLMQKASFALLTCIFALGGATVGTITGAIKGHTTETGLVRGAGVGFVAGAITAIQLMELMINGEQFSKVALLHSLVNGKIFMEWVSPAVLKAYLWQISAAETSSMEIQDIFEVTGTKGFREWRFCKYTTKLQTLLSFGLHKGMATTPRLLPKL